MISSPSSECKQFCLGRARNKKQNRKGQDKIRRMFSSTLNHNLDISQNLITI